MKISFASDFSRCFSSPVGAEAAYPTHRQLFPGGTIIDSHTTYHGSPLCLISVMGNHAVSRVLSRQIMNMEHELNMTLFVPEKNSVTLTPAGQALFDGLQKIYESYFDLVKNVTKIHQGFSGNLRIAITEEQLMSDCLKSAIRKYHLRYPDINITIETCTLHTIRADLLEGHYDIVNTLFLGDAFLRTWIIFFYQRKKGILQWRKVSQSVRKKYFLNLL